ncbi:MAG: DegT/DnrJ/EryC1/StrS family aminotransferase [candidate division KSB1 bacterium]|nr:DegT/DnrJ/EryC1/StrS family aminotransferase [candidate division KSB1 bacterium]
MKWRVPLADIDLGQNEIAAVLKVLKSKWLTMGNVTEEFEKQFANYLEVKYAFAVASGTAALHIAHQVLGLTKGDEVICPSLTFVATANSILYTGATPILADITSPGDLNMSPESVLEQITSRTKAITVVQCGGYPCNMDRIMEIAKRYHLYVIEDAAHAPGAEYTGKKIGTIGDIGCFSFFSNKNMTTGEGGMIVTNNGQLAEKIKRMRSHGMTTLTWDRHKGHAFTYDVVDLGYNYRIDEIRSAIGLIQLNKLNENNERRKTIVQLYRKYLESMSDISLPFTEYRGKPSFHIFPSLLKEGISRKDFIRELNKKGVQASVHYPPIHQFTYYKKKYNYTEGMLPKTEIVGKRELTLPLYPTMSDADVSYVSNAVQETIESLVSKRKCVS